MKTEWRIPYIDEFVPGFEYEYQNFIRTNSEGKIIDNQWNKCIHGTAFQIHKKEHIIEYIKDGTIRTDSTISYHRSTGHEYDWICVSYPRQNKLNSYNSRTINLKSLGKTTPTEEALKYYKKHKNKCYARVGNFLYEAQIIFVHENTVTIKILEKCPEYLIKLATKNNYGTLGPKIITNQSIEQLYEYDNPEQNLNLLQKLEVKPMKTYKIGICEKIHYKILPNDTRVLKPTNCIFYENIQAESEKEAVQLVKNKSKNFKYIFHISTSEDEKDLTLQLARNNPIVKSELAEELYSRYSSELFLRTKTLKEYLKNSILVFNRNGVEIKIYPLNKDGKHLTTINNIRFESLHHDDPLQNIWGKMLKEYPIELKDWRWLQNLDWPVQESNCKNIIGRFFERTEPCYNKLNLVRLSFGDNLDFKWFKGNTPEEVEERVDEYCLLKNLTAEATVLWPIYKSINNGVFKRPYTSNISTIEKRTRENDIKNIPEELKGLSRTEAYKKWKKLKPEMSLRAFKDYVQYHIPVQNPFIKKEIKIKDLSEKDKEKLGLSFIKIEKKEVPNKKRKGYINRKKEPEKFYAKKQWYNTKTKLNKAKSKHQPLTERLVCLEEKEGNKVVAILRIKLGIANALIDEFPERFHFTSKHNYKAFKKEQEKQTNSYPQHVKNSKLGPLNRRQRRTYNPKHSSTHTKQIIKKVYEKSHRFLTETIDEDNPNYVNLTLGKSVKLKKINTFQKGKGKLCKRKTYSKNKRIKQRNKQLSFKNAKKLNLIQGTFVNYNKAA